MAEKFRRVFFALAQAAMAAIIAPAAPEAQSREWDESCGDTPDNTQPISGDRLREGFLFYCDPLPKPKPEKHEQADTAVPPAPPGQTPAADRLEAMKRELEEVRATALLDPTEENVVAYMRLQKERIEQASMFAAMWKRAVWQIEGLDYELEHPQGTIGKRVARTELREAEQATLAGLNDRYGLVYIGSGSCAVCRAYGPILRHFAGRNRLSVLAVSTDGTPLPGWPEAVTDSGQLKNMGLSVRSVPVTALFDNTTEKTTVVGFGFLAESTLTERIHALTKGSAGDGF